VDQLPYIAPAHLTNYAITGGATAIKIADARSNRSGIVIQNQGTGDVYIGVASTVTDTGATRGFLLEGGQSPPDIFPDRTFSSEIYAYTPSGATGSLLVIEVYR
jgi:hypothetical protein